ncbi:MAG: hypothetical protein ABIH34_05085 [Nanoarchaeota archaeon]
MAIRPIAMKVDVKTIHDAELVKTGGWEPDRLYVGGTLLSRVNVIAVVVSSAQQEGVIDDGTGTILVRGTEVLPPIGSMILMIARVREHEERFLAPEIIKVLPDHGWLVLRKKELDHTLIGSPKEIKMERENDVLGVIRSLDHGEGADQERVMSEGKISEEIISRLLKEGEIFEVRPGRLKVLD